MAKILKEFNDSPHILNIELGAGCGNFGQKYHPECFLTEKRTFSEVKQVCSGFYATIFSCNAYNIPCEENRFDHVIMCNPYEYGFNDREDGMLLLLELSRVLINQGRVIILGTKANKFALPDKIKRRVIEFNNQNAFSRFDYSVQEIDCSVEYPDHIFFYTDAIRSTFPKYRTSLTCYK